MRLEGRVAIVTGAASGIGRAIALRYGREGARVAIADIRIDAARAVAAEIGAGAFAVEFDAGDRTSIERSVETVVATAGGIDILVNCAGVFAAGSVEDVEADDWRRLMAINVEGTLFSMQAAARRMVRQGRGGKIINFSSQAGRRGDARTIAYCATKAAVISITQSAGLHLIRHRINVNAIAPGVVDTPMWDTVDHEFGRIAGRAPGESKKIADAAVPYGRMGRPEDFEGMAVFLASPESDYVVAQTYGVDGGNWMA